MAIVTCRLDVSDFVLEVVPSTGPTSEEWNAYSVQVQRDGLVDTKQQTRWNTLASATKQQRRNSHDDLVNSDGATSIDGLLSKLSWAPCNQTSLIVEFRTGSSVIGATEGFVNNELTGNSLKKVQSKTNHQIALSVIARRRVENMSMSPPPARTPVLRRLRSFGSSPERSSPGSGGLLEGGNASFTSFAEDGRYGHFTCNITIDPAEVYNSPSGRLEYRLQVRDQDVTRDSLNAHLPGTPRYLCFSVAAQREAPRVTRLLRNYHDTCILLDQFVLDASAATRSHLEYGFGFFPDITNGAEKKRLTHYTRDFKAAALDEDGTTRMVNFSASTAELNVRNPVDVVIVSSESSACNNAMIGTRVVATARFKTDENTGLCKSSLKCTLVMALLWRDPEQPLQDTVMEAANSQRIDLAKDVMNQEDFPPDGVVRWVQFSYGERLYFRLRKRCFEGPHHYGMALLAPDAYRPPTQPTKSGDAAAPASPLLTGSAIAPMNEASDGEVPQQPSVPPQTDEPSSAEVQ